MASTPPNPQKDSNSDGKFPLITAKLWAFLATSDAERCRAFFEGKLGFGLVLDDPLALVFDSAGTMIRIQKVPRHQPLPFTALGWAVENIKSAVTAMRAAGVTFERFGGLDQDEYGIAIFPRGTRVAWFKDPDGNILSIAQLP